MSAAKVRTSCWMSVMGLVLVGCPTFPDSELHREAGVDAAREAAVDSTGDVVGEGAYAGFDAGSDAAFDARFDAAFDGGDANQDPDQGLDGRLDGPVPDVTDTGVPDAVDASDLDGGPLRQNGASCGDGQQCYSGHCRDSVCCNTACAGSCQACNLPDDVGICTFVPAGEDPGGECGPQSQASCGRDGWCDGAGGCRLHAAGTICVAAQCDSGDEARLTLPNLCDGLGNCGPQGDLNCAPYQCDAESGHCFTSCTDLVGCVQGVNCGRGECDKLRAPGAPCNKKKECKNDLCSAEGVCCDSKCDDPCRTCAFEPLRGKCSFVPAGLDPRTDCELTPIGNCGTDGTCDGAGACRLWPAGTPCRPATCESSLFTLPAGCSGSGECSADAPVSCGNYVCLQGSGCYSRCSYNSHCKPGCTCNQQTQICEGSC